MPEGTNPAAEKRWVTLMAKVFLYLLGKSLAGASATIFAYFRSRREPGALAPSTNKEIQASAKRIARARATLAKAELKKEELHAKVEAKVERTRSKGGVKTEPKVEPSTSTTAVKTEVKLEVGGHDASTSAEEIAPNGPSSSSTGPMLLIPEQLMALLAQQQQQQMNEMQNHQALLQQQLLLAQGVHLPNQDKCLDCDSVLELVGDNYICPLCNPSDDF